MTTHKSKFRHCPACHEALLQPATYTRTFKPHGRTVRVELLTSRCPKCGAQATSAIQHDENLRRLAARKSKYDGLLLGEEILALRRRYGITQQQAGKLFGKGKIAFSRYERETSYPDASTTKLLKAALRNVGNMRALAEEEGIKLPLLDARCADEREAKVRVIASVNETSIEANRWLMSSREGQQARSLASNLFEQLARGLMETPMRTTTVSEIQYFARVRTA